MAQFDVYENPNEESNQAIPYLLDLQADLLDTLATRVVAPLVAASAMGKAVKYLHPQFAVRDVPVFVSTTELAGIPVRSLGKKVGTLKDHRDEITAALDFLLTGF